MTSRLASLLVQEGLVSARKMAEAFQRQVIYGGTLDTILLEMDVVDEPALVEAMGRASGLPTAGDLPSREQLEAAGVRDWFPPHLSERFRAVPVMVDGNVVRVLVTDPPDRRQLDELGYMLSRSIDPIVVPEHRFVHAVELVYGISVPARFASLAAKVRQRSAEAPAPRIVEIEAEAPVEKLVVDTLRADRPPAAVVVTDVPMPAPRPRPVEPFTPKPAPAEERTAPLRPRQPDAPTAVVPEVTIQHGEAAPRETPPEPLALDEAARLLDAAEERDAIFEALCRGARSRLEFVALLMVHGDLAVGRMALPSATGHWLPRDVISSFSIPLDKPSPFRTAAAGKAPYLGRLGDDALAGQALGRLDRHPPLPAVLLPIVLRERTVALLYGDAGGEPIDASVLADLSTTVAAAGRAFQRIILRQKSGEFRPAPAAPTGKVDGGSAGSDAPAGKLDGGGAGSTEPAGGEGSGWRSAAGGDVAGKARPTSRGFAALAAAVAGEAGAHDASGGVGPAAPPMTDATALVLSVVREDAHARASADALVVLGERAAEAVVAHLPGPLRLDRHALRGPAPRVAEHGPLLSVLSRLGASAAKALVARANDPSLEVRYYVTLALGALDVPEVVPALGQRLFDPDAGVRHAAITGLRHASPSPELRTLTESLRGELPGPEVLRQRHAAEALGALRDAPSVPRLIELVKHPEPSVVTAARRALIEITKQDFGTSRWRWRSWWERHRNDSRVEWMLEGLGHAEPEVRMSASEELRGLSKDHFGYHFDGPKREREEARKRWVEWWRRHGSNAQRS